MSEQYLEQLDQEEEHEQYQNEEKNLEHENEEVPQEYDSENVIHNNMKQEEIQENIPSEDLYHKNSKNTDKTISKKSIKKSNIKYSKNTNTKNNVPSKTQMKKYKETSMKAMNYRVEIYKTLENCKKLEKDIEEKHKKLEKVNKERDTLRLYLNKLEKVMKQKTDTDNNDSTKIPFMPKKTITAQSSASKGITNQNESQNLTDQNDANGTENKLTISMTGTSPVITMDAGQGNKNTIKSKASLMKFYFCIKYIWKTKI